MKTFITGHRNPDVDSVAAAYALAELRRRCGMENVQAICPGRMPERGKYLFKRFGVEYPVSRNDLYLLVSDIMDDSLPTLRGGTTLFEAVQVLNNSGYPELPVVHSNGQYAGMLNPLNLLSKLLNIDESSGNSFAGRVIHTSIKKIAKVLNAKIISAIDEDIYQDFQVYVSAMSIERFEAILPSDNDKLAIIAGDRPEIHQRVLQRHIRLLIVTGNQRVEQSIFDEAREHGVSILRTDLDSATAIRRLKFSVPVEFFGYDSTILTLKPNERLTNLRKRVMSQSDEVLPVVGEGGVYLGAVQKKRFAEEPPYRLILVDHNEIEQSIHGAEELPIVEIVDHHRIKMPSTNMPIKFTADVVGSTCTLVAMMFRNAGQSLTSDIAGILLGGIIADTLNLKSPTTSEMDCRMKEWLEKISGVSGDELMLGMSQVASPMSVNAPAEIINGDRKNYRNGDWKFALSQVEETNLALLHQRKTELLEAMKEIAVSEELDFLAVLVTDAVRDISQLLIFGRSDVSDNLPYEKIEDGVYSLPGVLSRKKQLLPQILAVLDLL